MCFSFFGLSLQCFVICLTFFLKVSGSVKEVENLKMRAEKASRGGLAAAQAEFVAENNPHNVRQVVYILTMQIVCVCGWFQFPVTSLFLLAVCFRILFRLHFLIHVAVF